MDRHQATYQAALFHTILSLALLAASCDRSVSEDAPLGADPSVRVAKRTHTDDILSPVETVRRVHRHRIAGQIGSIEPYLLPDQRPAVVELIQSVDRLEWANDALQAAVTERFGRASALAFDRSEVANIVGVFSHDVEIVDERLEGDQAVVTIQVADRVPLEEVKLVRRGDRWLIQTDTPIPGMAKELRRLADVFVDAARRVKRDGQTVAELREELKAQQAPIIRRLAALTQRQRSP